MASEQPLDPWLNGGQHLRYVQSCQARGGVKIQSTGARPREDTVQHERVYVHVQIEGSPEPLDHGYRAPTTVQDAPVERTRAQAPEHGADEHGNDSAPDVVIPRQQVPHAVWEVEHPLPNGHVGEHVIEQV
jgi:hypothetical protein